MNTLKLSVVQGDYGYNLAFTLQNSAGVAVDLTGATLAFSAQVVGSGVDKFSSAMVIDTAASGTCHYLVQDGDFSLEGRYYCEITVTFAGQVLKYPNILVTATPAIPRS